MTTPAPPPPRRSLLRAYVAEVDEDRLLGLAAETAFFAVLSIFPALLVGAGLLGLLETLLGADVAEGAQARVLSTLSLVLTDQASGVLESVESLFETARGGLLTFATVGALVSLSGAFAVAVNALNLAHDTTETRSWLRRRMVGLLTALATLLLAVLALAVLVVGPLFGRGEQLADLIGLGAAFTFVWNVLRLPVMVAALLLWATALLRYAPARHLAWREAFPGAVLAAALWVVASAGLRVYVGIAAARNPVLGAFGGGAIVMTWVYLLSLSLLLGGELNAVLRTRRLAAAQGADGDQLSLFDDADAGRSSAWTS